jgi:hypothetical protein
MIPSLSHRLNTLLPSRHWVTNHVCSTRLHATPVFRRFRADALDVDCRNTTSLIELEGMEQIGNRKILSYYDDSAKVRRVANLTVRASAGHPVKSYFDLAKKVAELQFLNRDHVLLFRGQPNDYRTGKGNSLLKATIFRLANGKIPTAKILTKRFQVLKRAEAALVARYAKEGFVGRERLKRQRILRWAILQHYEVCRTPLLDVTQSLRIAASFASMGNGDERYLFVLGVPNMSGAITASSEANLQIVRLSSACPPEAVRPHVQEGYLLGEYPEIADFEQNAHYSHYEMDFGRRLIAKFRFDPATFWKSPNFPPATSEALYPKEHRDPLLTVAQEVKATLPDTE